MKTLIHTGRADAELTKAALDVGVAIHYQSFIITEALPASVVWSGIEWIFFTSPQSVIHFPAWDQIPADVKIGAMGTGTASHIPKEKSIAYVGEGLSTDEVAEDFARQVGTSVVLFPRAKHSIRSVQEGLPAAQVREVVCYETHPHGVVVSPADYYYFTSPSQVEGFFEKNEMPHQSVVIAIGETTAKSLREKGCQSVRVAGGYTSDDLMHTIKALQNG